MSKVVLGLFLVAFVAACAPKKAEPPYVAAPVTTEPHYTGKYK